MEQEHRRPPRQPALGRRRRPDADLRTHQDVGQHRQDEDRKVAHRPEQCQAHRAGGRVRGHHPHVQRVVQPDIGGIVSVHHRNPSRQRMLAHPR